MAETGQGNQVQPCDPWPLDLPQLIGHCRGRHCGSGAASAPQLRGQLPVLGRSTFNENEGRRPV